MMKKLVLLILLNIAFAFVYAQVNFNYTIELTPVNIPDFPGIHSFAFAQHNNQWLIIGGRKDGIHLRQPFNAFPGSTNNFNIYVIDITSAKVLSAAIDELPDTLRDQLQSSNMNFFQDGNTLYLAGGYGYSPVTKKHSTYPYLTAVNVKALITAVQHQQPIKGCFDVVQHDAFAVTGGQLGKINDTFYLVGGHRFDGRYNPMGHPTYAQTYTNEIRRFTLSFSSGHLSYTILDSWKDETHLRRRDFNLLPQIFPDGKEGYMISAGVFQPDADLPFLYPVDITSAGYKPYTSFNQLLSHYHSAKVSLYDKKNGQMHMLFFGGMSQYYYEKGDLVKDDRVPFVKTISVVSRDKNNKFSEYHLPETMPGYLGSSAEFIHNPRLPHTASGIIRLNDIQEKRFLIGYIVGGIESQIMHAFFSNQPQQTKASRTIYAVYLSKK